MALPGLINFFKCFLKSLKVFFSTNQPTRNGVGVALPGLAPGFGRAGVASGGATREVPGYQATRQVLWRGHTVNTGKFVFLTHCIFLKFKLGLHYKAAACVPLSKV